jgi:hypothetical protein
MWVDGIKQQQWTRISPKFGAPEYKGIPTARNGGSGFNFFSFFDNMAGWNSNWAAPGVDGSVYVNDVVVSTKPIGDDYVVGKGYPSAPPSNIKAQ